LWDVTIGGDNYDDFVQAIAIPGGGYIISGESNSPVSGDKTVPNYSISNDLWTLKLDNTGNIVWDKVHGGDGAENLVSIIPLPGGEFVLAGSTTSDISGDVSETTRGAIDYWMIKLDAGGNKIWDKRFGGSAGERCLSAISTPDNGFILAGFTVSPAGGDITESPKGLQDYWIVKTDDQGNKQWDKRFGGTAGTIATHIKNAPGGGYLVAGYTDSDSTLDVSSPTFGGSDYWIMLIDTTGNKVWDERFGGTGNEFATSFSVFTDSSLMLFGYADTGYSAVKTDTSYGWIDYWMIKIKMNNLNTGISEYYDRKELVLFPNPTSGTINLTLTDQHSHTSEIIVTDISGKVCYRELTKNDLNPRTIQLDLSNLFSGFYVLEAKNGSYSSFSKFTICK
jgi:hypothetical protein